MTAVSDRPGTWGEPELVAVTEPVRRVAAARLGDGHSVDDVVQETLARLLAARDRLDGSALLPYAVTVARNLAVEQGRGRDRDRRHAHRVVDMREPERPDEPLLRHEEEQALGAALERLSEEDRRLLLAHELDGRDTASLAADTDSTPGGVAARLARTRARLRLDYVLALRGAPLPTLRCRPVLLAISAGDRRRQQSLRAGAHLLRCPTCAEISQPLLARRRALAGLLPWALGPALLARLRGSSRAHGPQVAVSAASVAAVLAVAVAGQAQQTQASQLVPAATSDAAATSPADRATDPAVDTDADPAGSVTVGDRPLRVGRAQGLGRYVGQQVRVRDVRVLAVPADEGFWLATPGGGRVWVHLRAEAESNRQVRAGQRLSFPALMVRHGARFARQAGVTAAEGAGLLTRQGAHLLASAGQLRRTD